MTGKESTLGWYGGAKHEELLLPPQVDYFSITTCPKMFYLTTDLQNDLTYILTLIPH